MKKGEFINFYLPYARDYVYITSKAQAQSILEKARELVKTDITGVAITYSANYGQTREIAKTYAQGNWNTQTGGANQAEVIHNMENLLDQTYSDLQHKMRIAPITTMNAYTNPLDPWNDKVLMGLVEEDLKKIKDLLDGGWAVLGWQNQETLNNQEHPYAVGGGVAALPRAVSKKIQQTLKKYAEAYKTNNT